MNLRAAMAICSPPRRFSTPEPDNSLFDYAMIGTLKRAAGWEKARPRHASRDADHDGVAETKATT